jgi:hypothetical protein
MITCLGASLLLGYGLRTMHKAEQQARKLSALWPAEQTTVHFTSPLSWQDYQLWIRRLPQGQWIAYRIEGDLAVIDGTFTDAFPESVRSPVFLDLLQQGQRIALVDPDHLTDRPSIDIRQQTYRVHPAPLAFLPAQTAIHLRSLGPEAALPDHFRIRLPATAVKQLLLHSPYADEVTVIDHNQRRAEAMSELHHLRRLFQGLTCAVAILVSLILMSSWTSEFAERKTEFALRRTLGATPRHLQIQVITESLATCAPALIIGLLAFLNRIPFSTLLTAFAGCLLVIFISCGIPAHRASRKPPAEILKHAS